MIIVYPDYYFVSFVEEDDLEEKADFRNYLDEGDINRDLFYEIDEEYIRQMVKIG